MDAPDVRLQNRVASAYCGCDLYTSTGHCRLASQPLYQAKHRAECYADANTSADKHLCAGQPVISQGQAYLEQRQDPHAPQCLAGYEGCLGTPSVHISCLTEGRQARLCGACLGVWRSRAALDPVLQRRCPGCESAWETTKSALVVSQPVQSLPEGPVAAALVHAMLMEGLLVDDRERILRRLQQEAPWLFEVPESMKKLLEYAARGVT